MADDPVLGLIHLALAKMLVDEGVGEQVVMEMAFGNRGISGSLLPAPSIEDCRIRYQVVVRRKAD